MFDQYIYILKTKLLLHPIFFHFLKLESTICKIDTWHILHDSFHVIYQVKIIAEKFKKLKNGKNGKTEKRLKKPTLRTLSPNISANRFYPDIRFVAVNFKYGLVSHNIFEKGCCLLLSTVNKNFRIFLKFSP